MDPDSEPDLDADPAIFVSDLQEVNKKFVFCLLLFEGTFSVHHFSKIKNHTQVAKQ
jgi:hypothetical protein